MSTIYTKNNTNNRKKWAKIIVIVLVTVMYFAMLAKAGAAISSPFADISTIMVPRNRTMGLKKIVNMVR